MKIDKVRIILILSFFWSTTGISQDYYYEQFTELDGLPSSMTYEMVQDSNGILWVGTENGLVSFDGDRFQRYTHPDLFDNDIIEIALSKNGRIYFANLKGQLAFVEKDNVYVPNGQSQQHKIIEIEINEIQNLIISRNLSNGKITIYEFFHKDGGEVILEETDYSNILVRDNGNYPAKYDNHSRILEIDSTIIQFINSNTPRYHTSTNNSNYFYGAQRVIYEMDNVVWKLANEKKVENIAVSKNKSFFFPEKGAYMYDSESEKMNNFLNDIQVNTAFVDKERNVWFSTPRDGLFKFPYLDFQTDIRDEIIISDYGVNDFLIEENGNMYIGTTTGQVLQYSKQKKLINTTLVSSDFKPITLFDAKGAIYGFGGRSICRKDKSSQKINIQKNNLFGLKSILVYNDTIVAGSGDGVHKFIFQDYVNPDVRFPNALKGMWLNALYRDNESKLLYAGTRSGLYVAEDNFNFDLVQLDSTTNFSITDLVAGKDNSLWLGTRNNGALRIRGNDILERYNTSNGLISNSINTLRISDNKLIVSTIEGVSIKDLNTGEERFINEMSGVIPKEILSCDFVNGEYWIASNSGLFAIKPDQMRYFKKTGPQLSTKDFYANGVKVDFEKPLEFSHDVNNVLINFKNVSLRKGSDLSIKYKINSSDSAWVFTSDPFIRLQSLKHGEYQIEAIGISDGKEEGNKVSLAFIISPPWWETLWARILGIIGIVATFRFFVNRRSKRIRKEETVKRNYLTQINKIKDQALQLQMNPHFIFNSLNAIQGFIGTEDEEMAMNYLARFARLIRLIFEHSKGNTISLEEELEFINLYLNLEKLRFKDKVDVQLSVDEEVELTKDMIKVPPLLIQPIVENSFKHGLFHKKGKGILKIDYSLNDDVLQIVIQDDGIGRELAKKISQKNTEKQVSSGIKTTLERIELLNFGKDTKKNKIFIEDIYNGEGKPAGTKTTLILNHRNTINPSE